MAVPAILAAPLPPPVGLGAKIFGTGSPVTLRIVPTDSAFTSEIFYFSKTASGFLGTNHESIEVTRDVVPREEEILIHIRVLETLNGFSTGPASENLDRQAHAVVRQESATVLEVGFEDIYGLGDGDFNDVIIEIEGARMSVPFSGLPLFPSAGSDLSLNPTGGLDVLPIIAGDASGVSIPLGDADGWQGAIGFDGQAPDAQLTYVARSAPGLPDLVGRLTTAADGMTNLELSFPRATGGGSLQVDAFLGGEKVASTQVRPTVDNGSTFTPVRYLEAKAKKVKKIKIKKIVIPTPIGPVVIEGIEIVFGATSGELEEFGNLDFDTLALTLSDGGFPLAGFSEIALDAANGSALTLESQSVSKFERFHRPLGGANLVPQNGALGVERATVGDADPGVAIELGEADSFDLVWSPFIPLGLTLSGSALEINARGAVRGAADQDLGTLRVTQLTMADTAAEIIADFTAVGSPTQRILLYAGETLIADVTGHAGAAGRALAWPAGVGKGQAVVGPLRLPCYTVPFPKDTWIQIPGGPWMVGDKLLILAENPDAGVESLSELSLRTTSLPPITLTGETVTPLSDL
jgi:hypothetical protein